MQNICSVYEEAARRHPGVFFGKVDTEAATDLSQAFQVRSIPTIIVFKKSELVFEQAGVIPPGVIDDLIARTPEFQGPSRRITSLTLPRDDLNLKENGMPSSASR